MQWLRATLFNLGMVLNTILFSSLTILCAPLPALLHSRIASGWAYVGMWWLAQTCGLRYRVLGADNIPAHACVILSKHQSAWETIAFQVIFPPQVWVMKRSLMWIPFLGWAFAALRVIAINRSAGREALKQLLVQGQQRLAKGLWVVIFPEGTRIAPGKKGKYHIGGAWLAVHSQATVIPVAHNAGEFWRRNAYIKTPGVITVSIGKPISTKDKTPEQVNQLVEQWIEGEMPKLNQAS